MKTDVISSHLKEDERILHPALFAKKIFSDPHYEVNIRIFKGLPSQKGITRELVVCQAVYKQEGLRILIKLAEENISDPVQEIKKIVDNLTAQGKGPFHLIRDAKNWCNIPLTKSDESVFIEMGLSLA